MNRKAIDVIQSATKGLFNFIFSASVLSSVLTPLSAGPPVAGVTSDHKTCSDADISLMSAVVSALYRVSSGLQYRVRVYDLGWCCSSTLTTY